MADASTWTFSGTPSGQADGSSLTLRVTASDDRSTAVSDDFSISFVTSCFKVASLFDITYRIDCSSPLKVYWSSLISI